MSKEKKVNKEEIKKEKDVKEEAEKAEGTEEKVQEEKPEEEAPETKEDAKEDEALSAQYVRLMADFQNYKRRVEKEKSDIYAYANEKIVSELLNVIDNFERALMVETQDQGFSEGMKLIFKQLMDVLTKSGLEEIEALGCDFDPNFHNAVMTEDNPEFESGKVTLVMQKGYLLNKKVIRPSMVKVNN